ncbi:MAG: hypothetical protein EBS38_02705 [Actinobacteria bacterium]|nr:hypothetical protein [Actinomycetota bacterium]
MSMRPVAVNLLAGFSGTGLKTAQEQLQGVGKSFEKLTTRVGKAAVTFAAFKGAQIIGDFAASAVTQARDLERNLIAVDTVFGQLSGTMVEFSKNAVDVGLSQAEAAKASTFLGSVLKQSGFSIGETAEQTQRLVALGADLALTYGYDVQEALLGMTALFRGEYDPIEKFGVAMKQSEINSELAARGLDKLEGSARRFAEQQIRLQFLYERSADAQGAFERGAGTLAVEQERLQASINNMLQTAGEPLLKIMAELAEAFVPVVQELTPVLIEQFEKLVPTGEDLRNKIDEIREGFVKFMEGLGTIVSFLAQTTSFIIQNIEQIALLVGAFYTMKAGISIAQNLSAAFEVLDSKVKLSEVSVKNFRTALLGGGIALAVGAIATAIGHVAATADDYVFQMKRIETASGTIKLQTDAISALEAEQKRLQDRLNSASGIDIVRYQEALAKVTKELEDARAAADAMNGVDLVGFRKQLGMTSTAAMHLGDLMKGIAPFVVPPPETDEDGQGEAAKNYVKIFTDKLAEELQKQSARAQLAARGASEALIESILGADGWQKVWQAIKSGDLVLKDLQAQFNRTAAGAEELRKKAEEGASPLGKILNELKSDVEINKATEALVKMGYAADFVKKALAGDDWQKIYDELIARTQKGVDRINEIWAGANADPLTKAFDTGALIGKFTEDAKKEAARQALIARGASEGLAEAILGSEDDWQTIYNQIISGTGATIGELQKLFNTTAAGLAEFKRLRDIAQADYDKKYKEFLDKIDEANDKLKDAYEEEVRLHEEAMRAYERHIEMVADFKKEFEDLANVDVFNTYERAIGRFESQSVKSFANVRKAIEQAFEKGAIDNAYRIELLAYARLHENLLNDIQRQRDELATKRSLVEALMDDVKSATTEAANITNLMSNIEKAADKIDVAKVIQQTVASGKNLKDFRVTLITNLADPLNQVASKAQLLTSNFQSVVDRTRKFLDNLQTLRKLGLDPMLFNQLVEAGVEAGGETAQALVDGGSQTVTEVNKLFGELNDLGAALAEETAQVMYGTGVKFTDSLMEGIQSKQDALEAQARELATAFANAFTPIINKALEIKTPAMPVAPQVPTYYTPENPPPGVVAPVMPDILKQVPEQITNVAEGIAPVVKDLSASINQVKGLIEGATRYINNVTDATLKAGGKAKLSIYEQILSDLQAGKDVNLSGVTSGLSTQELQTRTSIAPANVTYNITVTANNRAGGASAGEAVVKAIQDYVQTNGSVSNIVAGVGQVAV